jgi:hypothetical protein
VFWFAILGCGPRLVPTVDAGDDDDDDVVAPGACDGLPDGGHCDGVVAFTCDGGEVVGSEGCDQQCVDGECLSCAAPGVDPVGVDGVGPLHLVTDPGDPGGAGDAWRFAPVTLTGPSRPTTRGSVELVDRDGEPLTGDLAPGTVYLRATRDAGGSVTFAPLPGCDGDAVTLDVTAGPMPRLLGTLVPAPVGFDDGEDLFLSGRDAWVDVPVHVWPEREGQGFDAWLVPHTDPPTTDLTTGQGPFAGVVGEPVSVGTVPNEGPWEEWDVVADFDRDGTLSPGDLARGPGSRPIVIAGDLAAAGPHPTTQQDANGGSSFLQQRIYWPTDLDTLDPVPLVVISHGNGHDYRWYDYLGQHLASYGYVVMSHYNNTEPGPVAASRTTVDNTDALLGALGTFAGGALDGEIDTTAIVWVGHSRGGEGVVLAWRDLQTGQQSADNYSASDVVLISSIAPTLFEGPQQADPGPTPYHLIAGSADGDVTGGVEQGLTQYFRMFQGARSQRWVTYVQGADHNDFNCCGIEDSLFQNGGPLIGRPAAQVVSKVTHLALLEAHFHGRSELLELWARAPVELQPFGPTIRISSMYLPDAGEPRMIDDFQSEPSPGRSSSGGTVTTTVRNVTEGDLDDGNFNLTYGAGDPMNGMTWVDGNDTRPARGLVFSWDAGDDSLVEFEVPGGDRDLAGWDSLSLRACQLTRHPNTVTTDGDLTFTVELEDGAGTVASVPLDGFAAVPLAFDRGGSGNGRGWVNEFQTLRVPLSVFQRVAPTLELTDVRTVRLRFGDAWGTRQGALGIDDVLFARELP